MRSNQLSYPAIGYLRDVSRLETFVCLVEIEGLEPSLTEPESVVLPLHHISIYFPLPSPFVGEVATFSPSKTFFESPGSVAASGEASLPPVPLVGEVASGEALELGLQR